MTIGSRIKELRESNHLTQTELAEKLGTTKQTIYKYENGIITNIPSDKIEIMAKLFDVSPMYIMCWEDKPTFPPLRKQAGLKGARLATKKVVLDESKDEPIAIKATRAEWTEILNRLTDENRQKLQDYAEFLLLKQDQDGQEE